MRPSYTDSDRAAAREEPVREEIKDASPDRSDSGRSLRGHARSGPAGREQRASALRRLRPAAPVRAQIQNSRFKNCRSGCSLRPANRCTIDFVQGARSRADGPATRRSSPPPGGGCGLPIAVRSNLQANIPAKTGGGQGLLRPCGRKFNIQNSSFKITNSGRSLRRAPATAGSSGPSPGGGCGPLGPDGPERQQRCSPPIAPRQTSTQSPPTAPAASRPSFRPCRGCPRRSRE